MRLTILGLTIAGFALGVSPTWAQHASIFEQYVAAATTFGDAGGDPAGVRAQILDGLEGDWFQIGVVQPTSDDPKLFALVCEKSATAITVPNGFSFQTRRNGNTKTPWTTIYTARQGHEFGTYRTRRPRLRGWGSMRKAILGPSNRCSRSSMGLSRFAGRRPIFW